MSFSLNPRVITAVAAAAGLLYPCVVYWGIDRLPSGMFVVLALGVALGRLAAARGRRLAAPFVPGLVALVVAMIALGSVDARIAATAYPVFANLAAAAAFGLSLVRPPPLIEAFARLREADPSPSALAYMRKVTWIWFVFLLANSAMSAWTALAGDMAVWALYNGLISYVLMGALFAGEFAVRQFVRRQEARGA